MLSTNSTDTHCRSSQHSPLGITCLVTGVHRSVLYQVWVGTVKEIQFQTVVQLSSLISSGSRYPGARCVVGTRWVLGDGGGGGGEGSEFVSARHEIP